MKIKILGLLYNDDVKWIVYHGGFDFGYILNMMYGYSFPDSVEKFYDLIKILCPNFYDIKYLVKE